MVFGIFWYYWPPYGLFQNLLKKPNLNLRISALNPPLKSGLKVFFKKKLLLGYVFAILAAVLASLTHSLSKPLLDGIEPTQMMNPLVLAVLIYMVAGLFLTPIKKSGKPIRKMGGKNLFLLSMIGIAEVIAMIVSFFGITETTAVNASIFINAEIIFSISIAAILFKERLRQNEMLPFGLILLGVVAIPVGYDFYQHGMMFTNLVFGDLLIILGGLFFSISNIISKYVSDNIDAKRITQVSSFVAAGFGLVMIFNFNIPLDIPISQLPTVVAMGILDVGLATLLFIIALRTIGAIKTILIFSTATVFGMIFAHILLSEPITALNIVSIISVFVGLYWLRNRFSEEDETAKQVT
jgi:drug/metabolite transporter (DMT)-like permease